MTHEIYRASVATTPHAAATEAAGTVTGAAFPASPYTEARALLNVTAVGGTAPTLDVKFQTTDDPASGVWYDLPAGAFPQKTAAGTASLALSGFGSYLRAVQTVGGTGTPTATYGLVLVLKS